MIIYLSYGLALFLCSALLQRYSRKTVRKLPMAQPPGQYVCGQNVVCIDEGIKYPTIHAGQLLCRRYAAAGHVASTGVVSRARSESRSTCSISSATKVADPSHQHPNT